MEKVVNLTSLFLINKIKLKITGGIDFLYQEQKKDKYFGFETIFPSVLILSCLNQVKLIESKKIKIGLVKELVKEKSNNFSFNYWSRSSHKYKNEVYSDDLDDTFCALSALYEYDSKLINGKDMSLIANLLTLCESEIGGPYRTWVLPTDKSEKWADVDIAVNSNVAYFLKLQRISLPKINKLIEITINENKLKSPYYKNKLPLIYFISRFYKGKLKIKLKKIIYEEIKNDSSDLNLALAISSLVKLKQLKAIKLEWVETLIQNQNLNGSWKAADFYFYKYTGLDNDFIGSDSISTAFVIEALALVSSIKKNNLAIKLKKYKRLIRKENDCFLEKLNGETKLVVKNWFKKLFTKDLEGNVWSAPIILAFSLKRKYFKQIPVELLVKTGLINLYGWCAYTIYDDILDGDSDVDQLPIANIFWQKLDEVVCDLEILEKNSFLEFYRKIVQNMEIANFDEIKNFHFKGKITNVILKGDQNYQKLANKSLGHAISSFAILAFLNFMPESDQSKNLFSFFQNYLAARQMNDDIHDWEEDLKKGFVNSAGRKILKHWRNKNKDIPWSYSKLRVFTWNEIVPEYCNNIIKLLNKADKSLEKIDIIQNKALFKKMLNKIEISVKKALEERQKTLDFVESYY